MQGATVSKSQIKQIRLILVYQQLQCKRICFGYADMIGVFFFLLILCLAASIIAIAFYNKLIYLRISRENSFQQMLPQLDNLISTQVSPLRKKWKKATLLEDQVIITNTYLTEHMQKEQLPTSIAKEMRYFNHLTKERNARLAMFPTNLLAQLGGYTPGTLLMLDKQHQEGIVPNPKLV